MDVWDSFVGIAMTIQQTLAQHIAVQQYGAVVVGNGGIGVVDGVAEGGQVDWRELIEQVYSFCFRHSLF